MAQMNEKQAKQRSCFDGLLHVKHILFVRLILAVFIVSAVLVEWSAAQNLAADARVVVLGGAGDATSDIASKVIADQKGYRVIPIPLGIIQLARDRKIFDPGDPEFDPVRAIEYAADPLHLTLNRTNSAETQFVRDLVNSRFSRDLNAYRGFKPSPEIKATGLLSPSFGHTIRFAGDKASGTSQGIYVGAGPYISLGTAFNFDQNLIDILGSPTPVNRPNTTFLIGDNTAGQAA